MIAIIDYGVGNLFSLKSSFAAIGIEAVVTNDKDIIEKADKVILPGVGAFEDFGVVDRFIKISEENAPNRDNKAKYDEMKALFNESYEALIPLFNKLSV